MHAMCLIKCLNEMTVRGLTIAAHCGAGVGRGRWIVFSHMRATGVQPNHFTFACSLQLYAKLGFL